MKEIFFHRADDAVSTFNNSSELGRGEVDEPGSSCTEIDSSHTPERRIHSAIASICPPILFSECLIETCIATQSRAVVRAICLVCREICVRRIGACRESTGGLASVGIHARNISRRMSSGKARKGDITARYGPSFSVNCFSASTRALSRPVSRETSNLIAFKAISGADIASSRNRRSSGDGGSLFCMSVTNRGSVGTEFPLYNHEHFA